MNREISAIEAAKQRESDPNLLLLDVREDSEWAICRIEGSLHIPMAEIPARADSLPRDRPIVVLCHHGMRSAHVQQYLQARGFDNITNLGGGIHAWAVDVEPDMARY